MEKIIEKKPSNFLVVEKDCNLVKLLKEKFDGKIKVINNDILKVKENAKKANIDDFINTLPDGYETRVGESGLRLSGGQKQRLFIARELFREPKILILDEATSSLDTLSEKTIKKSIDFLKGKITIILIAHRISTIKDSDFIYVIDKGNILEKGTYSDLKNKQDSFFNYLISSQKL